MGTSSHSLMATAAQNERDIALRHAESLGNFGLAHRSFKASDFSDFLWGQKFLEEGDESHVDSMLFVHSVRSPFKIGRGAVRFDAVNMIDDGESIWVRNEGQCHKPVEQKSLSLAVSEKGNLIVATPPATEARSQNFPVACLQTKSPYAQAIETAHTTDVADFVAVPEVCDRNRSPFFREGDIHLAGFLSGSDGVKIKDPLRATTFSGSAIMASGSNTYNRSIPCQ